MQIQGAITALITPMRNGQVDFVRLSANIAHQVAKGIDGLVPVGTTGESPTLSHDEHRQVIEHVVGNAAAMSDGKVKVIAGTGSNSTSEALSLTRHARKVGAHAALMVNPYYNKPSQEGLYRHFKTVSDAVDLPIVLYNIPGRTGITMSPQTVARLRQSNPNIVAIKEATGSMDIASEIASLCDITLISGDDSMTLPLMSIGGKGVISVLSNLLPDRVKALTDAGLSGKWDQARKLHLELFPLAKGLLSIDTNPIPIKIAMSLAGLDTGELRLPLCETGEANRATIAKLLRDFKVIV